MAKRLLAILLSLILILQLSSCAAKSSLDIMDSGAQAFGEGKTEDSYHLKSSDALLDELIDKFSGSYYTPSFTEVVDDDDDDDYDDNDDDSSQSDGEIPEVSNMNELIRLFRDVYSSTEEKLVFTVADGFSVDLSTDLQAIYNQLQREDPINISGLKGWQSRSGGMYIIELSYHFDIDELKRIKSETQALVDKAVKDIAANGKSDYEIACAVNNYLCDTVYYPPNEPYEPVTHTAYGALKNGCAVCEGYACAAKLLLNGYGIECDIQIGECLGGGGHAWNLVKLDNKWYQMDVTWNDESFSREDYFLVTDNYMKQSRTWDESLYPKSAIAPYSP